jgi:hypothetical protein
LKRLKNPVCGKQETSPFISFIGKDTKSITLQGIHMPLTVLKLFVGRRNTERSDDADKLRSFGCDPLNFMNTQLIKLTCVFAPMALNQVVIERSEACEEKATVPSCGSRTNPFGVHTNYRMTKSEKFSDAGESRATESDNAEVRFLFSCQRWVFRGGVVFPDAASRIHEGLSYAAL